MGSYVDVDFICFLGCFLVYVLIRFSSKNNPKASHQGLKGKFSKYAEFGVIGFELFLLFALAIPGYYDLKYEKLEVKDDSEIEIRSHSSTVSMEYPLSWRRWRFWSNIC